MSLFDDAPSMSPSQFFAVSADCMLVKGKLKKEKDYLLPSNSDLLGEDAFADVYAGWSPSKLIFYFDVGVPFQKIGEGDWSKGDSIELFLDTRDMKTKSTVSKFCHHFVFFPALSQNFYGREVTRFRSDDMHNLCHPEDLNVDPKIGKKSYTLLIEIPKDCLYGYDPLNFPRIGFTYQINRTGAAPQHFAVSSEEYAIEQSPSTWGTLNLHQE